MLKTHLCLHNEQDAVLAGPENSPPPMEYLWPILNTGEKTQYVIPDGQRESTFLIDDLSQQNKPGAPTRFHDN